MSTIRTAPPDIVLADPLPEREVSDVETLKALSDPLRIRILEVMTAGHDQAWTVKRLAAELGVGATKLYHHVNVLEERGLVRAAGTRVVQGIIETSYQVSQRSLRLDRRLFAGRDVPAPVHELLQTVLDGVRDSIEASIRAGAAELDPEAETPRRLLLSRGLIRIPEDRIAEVHARLAALMEEFDAIPANDGDQAFGYIIGLFPVVAPAGSEEDEA